MWEVLTGQEDLRSWLMKSTSLWAAWDEAPGLALVLKWNSLGTVAVTAAFFGGGSKRSDADLRPIRSSEKRYQRTVCSRREALTAGQSGFVAGLVLPAMQRHFLLEVPDALQLLLLRAGWPGWTQLPVSIQLTRTSSTAPSGCSRTTQTHSVLEGAAAAAGRALAAVLVFCCALLPRTLLDRWPIGDLQQNAVTG